MSVSGEDFDTILDCIGTGKWNLLFYIIIALWKVVIPYHALAGAFISPLVNHTCRLDAHLPSQTTAFSGNITFVEENYTNTINVFSNDACSYTKEDATTGMQEEVACTEWDFDNSTFSTTVTSEFNLVCDRQYLRATYQSIYMGGFMVGAFFGGHCAYRYGRLTTIVVSSVVYTALAIGSAWLPSLTLLLISRFLLGAVHPTSLGTGVILMMEVTTIKWRTAVLVTTPLMWSVGTALWGLFAYLERDWRWLQTYVSFIGLLVVPLYFFLDESPRWLVVRGHHKKALAVLQRAAKMNGTTLPPDHKLLTLMRKIQEESSLGEGRFASQDNADKGGRLLKQVTILFSTRKLITITVVTSMGFLSSAMVFFGLTLAASSLGVANPFIYVAMSGFAELPSFFAVFIINRIGRKKYGVFIFSVCAAALVLQALPSASQQWLSITLVMIGKIAASSALTTVYLYTSELYPTEVRTQGLSAGMISSRIGAFIAPFIISALEFSYPWAISVVFGLVAALPALFFLLLWETGNTCLPDTIAQLEGKTSNTKTKTGLEEMTLNAQSNAS